MYLSCLDLEGVLVPEIWISFAEETGIRELRLTTRNISDYDALMKKRIGILRDHGLKLKDIQNTIEKIEPLPGAKSFLDKLRALNQAIILSDTFVEFAKPLMIKLGMPVIFCNSLELSEDGYITGYRLRQANGKFHAVKALQSIGFKVIAFGDSFNDLDMIKQAETGFLFRPPKLIEEEYSHIKSHTDYDALYKDIERLITANGN
ncbi:bifunctional phosphoserine phosphatase/homoserine phosphotransferase ThrH [Spirochaetota bacterium]